MGAVVVDVAAIQVPVLADNVPEPFIPALQDARMVGVATDAPESSCEPTMRFVMIVVLPLAARAHSAPMP